MNAIKIRITESFDPGPGFHLRMIPGQVWLAEDYSEAGQPPHVRIPYQGLDCKAKEGCYERVSDDVPCSTDYIGIPP